MTSGSLYSEEEEKFYKLAWRIADLMSMKQCRSELNWSTLQRLHQRFALSAQRVARLLSSTRSKIFNSHVALSMLWNRIRWRRV